MSLPWSLLAAGAAALSLLHLLAWLWHLRTRNAGWVDVAWALGIGLAAVLFALGGPGDPGRRVLAAALAGLWSLRLGLHLALRVARDPEEDGRYRQLRREWGGNLALKFLGFFQFQALLDLLLAVPFLLASLDPSPRIHPLAWIGAGMALLAMAGEALADAQLRAYKAGPHPPGGVCRRGLWAWSRHPNYFFEWLTWVGFALLAAPSPWGWTAFAAPALILFFLLRVTGIPATEAQALRSKGDAYRRYQAEVSAFVPWFPRTPAEEAP